MNDECMAIERNPESILAYSCREATKGPPGLKSPSNGIFANKSIPNRIENVLHTHVVLSLVILSLRDCTNLPNYQSLRGRAGSESHK